jgi:hypothetical protein
MRNQLEKESPGLKIDPETTAGTMMIQLSYGVPILAEKGKPCAELFQQGMQVLDRPIAEYAGTAARNDWLKRMEQFEDREIGPIRGWLSKVMGQEQHPVLQQSINWIEQKGDPKIAALQMLLSDLYMAVGDGEKAKTTYAAALRMHRESGSTVPLVE